MPSCQASSTTWKDKAFFRPLGAMLRAMPSSTEATRASILRVLALWRQTELELNVVSLFARFRRASSPSSNQDGLLTLDLSLSFLVLLQMPSRAFVAQTMTVRWPLKLGVEYWSRGRKVVDLGGHLHELVFVLRTCNVAVFLHLTSGSLAPDTLAILLMTRFWNIVLCSKQSRRRTVVIEARVTPLMPMASSVWSHNAIVHLGRAPQSGHQRRRCACARTVGF